jgi:hypothetical protein
VHRGTNHAKGLLPAKSEQICDIDPGANRRERKERREAQTRIHWRRIAQKSLAGDYNDDVVAGLAIFQ